MRVIVSGSAEDEEGQGVTRKWNWVGGLLLVALGEDWHLAVYIVQVSIDVLEGPRVTTPSIVCSPSSVLMESAGSMYSPSYFVHKMSINTK